MREQWGIGKVIGVDLSFETPQRIGLDRLPGPRALLRDRLRPGQRRRYRLLVSVSRQRASGELADVYIKPALARVGMLQWGRLESTVQQGPEHALHVLDGARD